RMVVVALDRAVRAARRGAVQRRVERLLGPGLADRAGDADYPGPAARARRAAEIVERLDRVGRADVRMRNRLAHQSAGGAGGEGLGDEKVAVGRLALHRDEQVAGADLARIEGDAVRL